MKILVADDEIELTRVLSKILEINKYEVDVANNGQEAYEKATQNKYDILILDVMMPKMTGFEVVKNLRDNQIETPAILLTAKSEIEDKVKGLDEGANDYLTKPFNKDELLARIRALTRKNQAKIYKIGNLKFDNEKLELSSNKASFRLNNKECDMMKVLVTNLNRNLNRIQLKEKVWQDEEKDEKIVDIYISYLQNKIKALNGNVNISNNSGYRIEIKND